MAKDPGYVYILTNKSFREDWVKIGKSSRPVDVRSKELDNTAVPLPFDIYATLRSVKYNEVEKQLHSMLDLLTNTRIRKNREFFNVQPDKALECFKTIATTLDDAFIEIYQDGKVISSIPVTAPSPVKPVGVIECFIHSDAKGCDAKAYLYDDGKMTLLKGSVISNTTTASYAAHSLKLRDDLIKKSCTVKGGVITTTEDIEFMSPSGPADFVLGRSSNGWTEWKDGDGNLIQKYRK